MSTPPAPVNPAPMFSACQQCHHASPRLYVGPGGADYVRHRCAHPVHHTEPATVAVLPLHARGLDFTIHGCPLVEPDDVAWLLADVARQAPALAQQTLAPYQPRADAADHADAT